LLFTAEAQQEIY